MKLIFDVETNGFKHCSVLSFSAVLLDEEDEVFLTINRYYHPNEGEKDDVKAQNINGLTREAIETKRQGVCYPLHFKDDKELVHLFESADTLIAHNIEFTLSHILANFNIDLSKKKLFCTMQHYSLAAMPWPKLSEAVEFFNIDVNKIKRATGLDYHSRLFDVHCTLALYKKLRLEA